MIELTVPYEHRIEQAHVFKTEKYSDTQKQLTLKGYKSEIMAVEVGARGFVGASMCYLLKQLNIHGRKRTRAMKDLAAEAEKCSRWLWSRRNESIFYKDK